ncbi:MAG: hypothetical protein R3313_03355 [Candidatus Saccharimonadales bacterium]|nr:hypothetical protein [Candidatus Saccharimonadales bacterium]
MADAKKPEPAKTVEEKPKEEAAPSADPAAKKKWPLWKKVVVGFVVFFVVIFVTAFFMTKGASDAAGKFVDDLKAGDCSGTYSQFIQEFQDETEESLWTAACQQIGPVLTGDPVQKSAEVSSSAGDASDAEVLFEIEGNDGYTYDFLIQLTKQDGEWKVVQFDSDRQE